jgi:hypothetical protein
MCMCGTVHTRLHIYLGRLDKNYMNYTINAPAPFICCQERCPDLRVQFRDGQVHLGLGMCVQRNSKSLSASHRNNMATIVHAMVVRERGLCTTSAFASKTASRSAIGAKWFECCGIQLDSGTTSGDICACNAFISSCSTSTLIMSSDEGLHTYMHARRSLVALGPARISAHCACRRARNKTVGTYPSPSSSKLKLYLCFSTFSRVCSSPAQYAATAAMCGIIRRSWRL